MAQLSCGGSLMKYILFLFNIVFFIAGAALLGVGIWLKADPSAQKYLQIVDENSGGKLMSVALWVLIAVGAFIFLVGFLGCCGACKESSCMLSMYAGFLILLVVLEIAVAVMAIVFKGKLGDDLRNSMAKQVKGIKKWDFNDAQVAMWNTMQFNLKCCGSNNYTDFHETEANTTAYPMPPQTCCKMDSFDVSKVPTAKDYKTCQSEFNSNKPDKQLHPLGCHQALADWIKKHAGILIGIAIAIALIQLVGIVFACCVRKQINEQ